MSECVRLKCIEKTLRLYDIRFISPTFLQKLDSYSFKLLVGVSMKATHVSRCCTTALRLAMARWRAGSRATGRKMPGEGLEAAVHYP